VTTAAKQDKDTAGAIGEAIRVMTTLNRAGAEAMATVRAHACTDITGFGLLGHLRNVAAASGCSATVRLRDVPVPEAAWAYVREGIVPGGTHANWRFLDEWVQYDGGVDKPAQLVLCDAQTSGGLLIAVAREDADALCSALQARKALCAAVVGTLESGPVGHMRVVP
jgi:selenide,water dikinase